MAAPRAVWGIDIGQCALKAIKIRPAGEGKVEVLAHAYVEHKRILSQRPEAERTEMVASALEKFMEENDLGKDPVIVGVPGQHTLARFTKFPPVEKKKIVSLIQYEAGQQIPFDLEDVIWDYQIFTEEDNPDVEVGIFAMKRELIRDHLLPYTNASVVPTAVQASPLALYNAMYFDGRCVENGGTVILDIGAENTDLIISEGKSLWTRTIPMGGNHFTEALVKAFKLSFTKAEKLKKSAATSKYARQVFQAMRPVFADLASEIQRSIGFYTSSHRGVKLKSIVAMGNAFKLPGLQKFLQQNLSIPVDRPANFNMLEATPEVDSPVFIEHLLSFGVSYGLALQGLNETNITSNLLPPEVAKQVIWKKKRPWFAAAAACLGAAAGAVWMGNLRDHRTLEAAIGPTGDQRRSFSVEQANQELQNPDRPNMAPREVTQLWIGVADAYRKAWTALDGQGDAELANVKDILDIQASSAHWMKILSLLHESLPEWQPVQLAQAPNPDAYAEVAKSVPRNQRKQVFIDSFQSDYAAEVETLFEQIRLEFQKDEGGIAGPEVVESSGQVLPGFLVQIQGRTPFAMGVNYVQDSFRNRLLEIGRKPGMGFFVDQVAVVWAKKFGGGEPARRSSSRQYAPVTTPELVDPVTGDSLSDDWQFTLLASVAIGEPPVPEETEAVEGAAEGAQVNAGQ